MSIIIELVETHQLGFQEDDTSILLLPSIEIRPVKNSSTPYISQIHISISGIPDELAKQIQSIYKNLDLREQNLLELSKPLRLKQSLCKWEKPLPNSAKLTLKVSIEYYDYDPIKTPKVFTSERQAEATCNIWTPSVQELINKEIDERTPEIDENPYERTPEIDENPYERTPEIDENPYERTPEIDENSYEITPETDKINKKDLGWLAIDFGTSNSTVTLYEPKFVIEPNPWFGELEECLGRLLDDWLNKRLKDELIGVSSSDWDREWDRLETQLNENFFSSINSSNFRGLRKEELLEGIRQLETTLNDRQPWFCSAASIHLSQIYLEVFGIPLLDWQGLIKVQLDKDLGSEEIPSELEIVELETSSEEKDPKKVKVLLGHQVRSNRIAAIKNKEVIEGRFFHSPKALIEKNELVKILFENKEDKISVNKLIQAAYAQLIKLTNKYRKDNPDKCNQGGFYRAVVTYPSIISPFARLKIKESVENLGIDDVRIAYDEAVSVAIFFLWKKFGGNLNIGVESFKTRCYYSGSKWWQNVLVLDIGGGTTDLALIRLTLEEIDPFESNEDRGDGGRYYKLTPKLLGSSGHMQLGGELITLEIFRLLKASIVDSLLTAVTEGRLDKKILGVKSENLNPHFLNKGKYKKGSLLACVEMKGDNIAYSKALKDIEKVLPTHWAKLTSRLQTFYTLWRYAEQAKLQLGKNYQNDEDIPVFILDGQKIAELLQQNSINISNSEEIKSLKVELTVEQFEKAAIPHIREAIGIAKGLVENTFKPKSSNSNNSLEVDFLEGKQKLNWLILSGKTCNFPLVKRELYQAFSKSDYFVWNEDRITFEPKYTKLATSAGACLAEKFRQLSFDSDAAKVFLKQGANQLYIDVKNLFYFLPCSFEREILGQGQQTIFQTGDPLYQIQAVDEVAKSRSDWEGIQLLNNIRRKDFKNKTSQFWGGYNADALRKELGMSELDFRKSIKVQFEINQQLDIDLLLCWGYPYYLIPNNLDFLSLDATKVIDATKVDDTKVIDTQPVISQEGKVICDIAVCVAESAHAMQTDNHNLLFDAEVDYSKKLTMFISDDQTEKPQKTKGLVKELPRFPLSGEHTFYFRVGSPQSNKWELIGKLPLPKVETDFPYKHYVSLNENGIIRVHAFEVPYWTSEKQKDIANKGCVIRHPLELKGNQLDPERNPFSGEH